MKLNLSIEGKILASTQVLPFAANNEYYLKAFRRLLVLRHHKKLQTVKNKPHFFVEVLDKKQAH